MIVFAIMCVLFSVSAIVALSLVKKFFEPVPLDHVLVINRAGNRTDVSFAGTFVLPIVHRAETMSMRTQLIRIARSADDPTVCKSGENIVIEMVFYVGVGANRDDVMHLAQAIGCERASDPHTLKSLFSAQFNEAIKAVVRASTFDELRRNRDSLRDRIMQEVGIDLDGHFLDDAAIIRLEAVQAFAS